MIQRHPKMSLALGDDDKAALATIKQYYGFTSNAAALRRALAEHAKEIKAEKALETQVRGCIDGQRK